MGCAGHGRSGTRVATASAAPPPPHQQGQDATVAQGQGDAGRTVPAPPKALCQRQRRSHAVARLDLPSPPRRKQRNRRPCLCNHIERLPTPPRPTPHRHRHTAQSVNERQRHTHPVRPVRQEDREARVAYRMHGPAAATIGAATKYVDARVHVPAARPCPRRRRQRLLCSPRIVGKETVARVQEARIGRSNPILPVQHTVLCHTVVPAACMCAVAVSALMTRARAHTHASDAPEDDSIRVGRVHRRCELGDKGDQCGRLARSGIQWVLHIDKPPIKAIVQHERHCTVEQRKRTRQ
jgi:hypothetical protein